MGLSFIERLIVFAALIALLATSALAFTLYIWINEEHDRDEVHRYLRPVLPGLEAGELPSASWMMQEIMQRMFRVLPNPNPIRMEYAVDSGTQNYPVLTSGHLLYTCPEDKRAWLSEEYVNFGQKPAFPSPSNHFFVLERPGSGQMALVSQYRILLSEGDKLHLFGSPGLQTLSYVIECDYNNATPRTFMYNGNSPFTYTPPAGHQAVSSPGADLYFNFMSYSHHNTAIPGGSTLDVFREGEKIQEVTLFNAGALNRPSGGGLSVHFGLNPGQSISLTWPAALDGYMSVAITMVEIPVS